MAFLCMDEPKVIVDLIEKYPQFKELYEDVYEICRNMEDFMDIFSKELRTLDQNTVRYMFDQMQEDIDRQKEMIDQLKQEKEEERQEKEKERQEKEKERQNRMKAEKTANEADKKVQELQNQLQEVLNRLSMLEKRG